VWQLRRGGRPASQIGLGIWLLRSFSSRPLGWFRASALRKLFVFRLGLAHIKRVGLVGRDTWLVMSGEHRCLVLEW